MKILVVEDEPASLKLAHLVLTADGCSVTGAQAAEEVIDAIARSEPDAILLDLELPGIDGLTLARTLKSDPKTRHISIIAVTAFPEQYSRKAAMLAGCDAYLTKPLNTRKLSEQIATTLEGGEIS